MYVKLCKGLTFEERDFYFFTSKMFGFLFLFLNKEIKHLIINVYNVLSYIALNISFAIFFISYIFIAHRELLVFRRTFESSQNNLNSPTHHECHLVIFWAPCYCVR
jgi:hypothetical protein